MSSTDTSFYLLCLLFLSCPGTCLFHASFFDSFHTHTHQYKETYSCWVLLTTLHSVCLACLCHLNFHRTCLWSCLLYSLSCKLNDNTCSQLCDLCAVFFLSHCCGLQLRPQWLKTTCHPVSSFHSHCMAASPAASLMEPKLVLPSS